MGLVERVLELAASRSSRGGGVVRGGPFFFSSVAMRSVCAAGSPGAMPVKARSTGSHLASSEVTLLLSGMPPSTAPTLCPGTSPWAMISFFNSAALSAFAAGFDPSLPEVSPGPSTLRRNNP